MDMKDKLAKAYGSAARRDDEDKSGPKPRPRAPKPADAAPAAKASKPAAKSAARDGLIRATVESERLIKTGIPGTEKAAKFLLLLGQDEAAKVLRHMKPDEIEAISRHIAKIDRIDTAEANEILTEFGWLVRTQGESLEGGPDTAERMLVAAFGAEKAKELLRKAVPESRRPFAFLNDFDAKQLIALFKDESAQVLAMILPYLEPKLASAVVSELSDGARTEVIKRIAKLDRMSPEVLERVEQVLRDKIARVGRPESAERVDGAAVLAGILKHVGGDLEGRILRGLEDEHPELSEDIRERLFTMDDVLRVPDRELQRRLREYDEKELALILKGKSQALRDKLLSNVSQSKRMLTLEEYDIMGTVRRDEVDKATRNFLAYFKRRWEDGELALEGDDELVD